MNSPIPSSQERAALRARPWPVRILLACLVLACLLPGLIGAGVLIVRQYQESQDQLGKDRVRTARALVQAVDGYLMRVRSVGETLATDESIAQGDLGRFRQRAKEVLAHTGIGANVILVDESAQQVFNLRVEPGAPIPRAANPAGIRQVFATGKPVVSDVVAGSVSKRPATAMHVPVSIQERVVYVLSIVILTEEIKHILSTQNLPADWVTAIFDSSGTTVARTHAPERFVGQKGAADLISHIREFPEGIVENTTREGIRVVNAYSRSAVTGWSVVLGIPRESLQAPLTDAFSLLALGIAGLFATGLGLAWIVGGKVARSFQALVQPAKALGSGGAFSLPPVDVKEAAELAKAMGNAADLLQRRTADLRLSEEKYRTLFSNMTEGFCLGEPVFDRQGRPVDFRFLEVNEAFYVETGLPHGIIGRPAREYAPLLEQSWIDTYNRVALTGKAVRFQNYNADTRRVYDVHVFCPTPGRFAVVGRDITEIKRVEAQLTEQEAYLRQLIATLPGMVWTCTPDGSLEFVSQQWLDYTGTSLASQLGTGAYGAIHPEDREPVKAVWLAAVAEESLFTIEYRLRRHDGQYRWFKSRGTPLRDSEGKVIRWLGVIIDIDDLKQAEAALEAARQSHLQHLERQVAERTAALQEARDQLERRVAERTEEVRRLAADITFAEERERQAIARDLHDDLGQLLHVVKIRLEMLAREVAQPRGQALVEETGVLISDASRQVRSLTSQLSPPVLSTLGLPAALQWLCSEIQETYGLAVACRTEAAPCSLSAAENAILFRAARELLINAAKHSGSPDAALELAREEGILTLAVADSGNGTPVRREALQGTPGFGLASIRERIAFLGGTVEMETPPGGGLKVTLRLPVEEERPAANGPSPASQGAFS